MAIVDVTHRNRALHCVPSEAGGEEWVYQIGIPLQISPTEFGPAPAGSIWRADHPVGLTVRLADGQWHHVLCYRVLDREECVGDAALTPRTGTYVEEVTSNGDSVWPWEF